MNIVSRFHNNQSCLCIFVNTPRPPNLYHLPVSFSVSRSSFCTDHLCLFLFLDLSLSPPLFHYICKLFLIFLLQFWFNPFSTSLPHSSRHINKTSSYVEHSNPPTANQYCQNKELKSEREPHLIIITCEKNLPKSAAFTCFAWWTKKKKTKNDQIPLLLCIICA